MAEHNGDRTLRLITLLSWIPGFALLLAHGIVTHTVMPSLGIIPLTLSALTGLIHLVGHAKNKRDNILLDLFTACFLVSFFVPGIVFLAEGRNRSYYWDNSRTNSMLGSYATVPLMSDFAIHAYLVLREINLRTLFTRKTTCPHCHGALNGSGYRSASQHSSDSKEDFSDAPDAVMREEAQASSSARPSTDDETAPLV